MLLSEQQKHFIQAHLTDDVKQLALSGTDKEVLNQIAGRQKIRYKIPSWYNNEDLLFPPALSIEQSSSEQTARYKSTIIGGDTLVDLTGGFGVDSAFLSSSFNKTIYVEKQRELSSIVRHNFAVLGLLIEVINEDALSYLNTLSPVDCIYIDPSRRSHTGSKVMKIEDCEPDIAALQDILLGKAGQVLVKLSPMLDIKSALKSLPYTKEVHVVSVDNECKELLFLMSKQTEREPLIRCINYSKGELQHTVSFTYTDETNSIALPSDSVKQYLYEPNSSILKAGYFKGISEEFNICKLHPSSHLYTSDKLITDFPGRIFQVEGISTFNKKEINQLLKGIDKAHVAVRNFYLPAEKLRKKLGLKEGGTRFVFATTLQNNKHVLIVSEQLA